MAACGSLSWYDFVTAMPSLVFIVTGWKSNGKENACLQSWSSFVGSASGLTAEKSLKVNAPRIRECFLNIECEFLWEHELVEGSQEVAVALKAVNICMDSKHYDQSKLGRYGKSGFLFNVDQPANPDTGEITPFGPGILEQGNPIPWITK